MEDRITAIHVTMELKRRISSKPHVNSWVWTHHSIDHVFDSLLLYLSPHMDGDAIDALDSLYSQWRYQSWIWS